MSVGSKRARARALEMVEKLRPQLEELHAEAIKVRDDSDAVLVALYPILNSDGDLTDEMFDLANRATGFEDVWNACSWIGDLFGHDIGGQLQTHGLRCHEIARGGERDFPRDTIAEVEEPAEPGVIGQPGRVRVVVDHGPLHPLAEGGYLCLVLDEGDDRRLVCSHEEIRAGLVSLPDDDTEAGR